MTQPEPLDVNDVIAEMGRVYTELAANGTVPLVAELAQLRVLTRRQAGQIAARQSSDS